MLRQRRSRKSTSASTRQRACAGADADQGFRTGLRTTHRVVVVVILLIGINRLRRSRLCVLVEPRLRGANKDLNTVISHQNSLNTTFKDID